MDEYLLRIRRLKNALVKLARCLKLGHITVLCICEWEIVVSRLPPEPSAVVSFTPLFFGGFLLGKQEFIENKQMA